MIEIYADNLFYFGYINSIGGIETYFWNMAQKYGADHDILIVYSNGDATQIRRLSRYVRCLKWEGQYFKCKKAIFAFNLDLLPYVKAEEYIQVIHGDYKAQGVMPNYSQRIDRYLGVSEHVSKVYTELTGRKCEPVYNPVIVPKKQEKLLRLLSATRLTEEKGLDRMIKLVDALHEADIPFAWDIFSDQKDTIRDSSVTYHRPELNIYKYIKSSDYLVQLSSAEGYCYTVVEALMLGTPVIVTPCPVFNEIGVKDGVNGFILPFDMSEIPLKAITKGVKAFKYTPIEDRWGDILIEGTPSKSKLIKLQCKTEYYDMEFKRLIKRDEIIEVDAIRADYLLGISELQFVRV